MSEQPATAGRPEHAAAAAWEDLKRASDKGASTSG
jgi:hypothetical protein